MSLLEEARRHARRLAGIELLERLSGTSGDLTVALGTLAADAHVHVVVGRYDGAIAGVGIARQLPPELWANQAYDSVDLPAPGPRRDLKAQPDAARGTVHVAVVGLYVAVGFRGVGVGESLLEALEHWARDVGAHELDVVALPGSRETKALLEAAGYRARAIVMHRGFD